MAGLPNIYVSNGTCYLGRKLEADPSMIPCGNDHYGHVACCQESDTCLESNACFNGRYFVTYVAGCSDPEYEHESCPDKLGDGDAPWLGMSYCNGTSDTWVLCDQHDHPGTIVSPDPCSCPAATASRTVTLAQLSTINATASLPSATGMTIMFMPGYYPTIPATSAVPTATSSSLDDSSPTTFLVPVTTSPSDAVAASSAPGLGTPATIGTAVGVSVVGLLLLGGLGALFVLRRRRQKQQRQGVESTAAGEKTPPPPPPEDVAPGGLPFSQTAFNHDPDYVSSDIGVAYGSGRGYGYGNMNVSRMSSVLSSPVTPDHPQAALSPAAVELDGKAARPWSMVSELDGNEGVPRPVSAAAGEQVRMEAILEKGRAQRQGYDLENGNGNGYGYGYTAGRHGHGAGHTQDQGVAGPSELPADTIAELPA